MDCFSDEETAEIERVLNFHLQATATKNVALLRSSFATDAVFVGTDDTEQWSMEKLVRELETSKAGWDMTNVTARSIYRMENVAVFFEAVIHKKFGAMRGSGVVTKSEGTGWKIAHYVLSFSVPNHVVDKTLLELLAS